MEKTFKVKNYFFHIQEVDDGYDYTFYSAGFIELDGGVYDDLTVSMELVTEYLLDEFGISANEERKSVDFDWLEEKALLAWQSQRKEALGML